ncbi:isochorismatase family protein family [Stagonosporopsis vannaccii]|nr:isochorismatase family protein family [Stagonosporopsis vannaccii]
MASFAEILAKKPKVQTRQALMVIGLQNEFISPTGHLPVDTASGFLEHIYSLVSKFRDLNGNIIWVQSLYEADRLANTSSTGEGDALVIAGLVDGEENNSQAGDDDSIKDLPAPVPRAQSRSAKHKQRALDLFKRVSSRRKALPIEEVKVIVEEDEELFLLKRVKKGAACVPDTEGAQFTKEIKDRIQTPRDALIKTTNYSAFLGTNLLLTLRARLITEIYVCGCLSNVSVLATVIDGARHGIKINVVQDALGFRKQARHDLALKRMEEFFDAYMVATEDVLAKEHFEVILPVKEEAKPDTKNTSQSKDELETLVGKLSLNEQANAAPTTSNGSTPKVGDNLSSLSNSPVPRMGDNNTTEQTNSDEEFAAAAARFRRAKVAGQTLADNGEPKLVQSKTRMRKKKKKKSAEGAVVEPNASNSDSKHGVDRPQPSTATSEETVPLEAQSQAPSNSLQDDATQQPLSKGDASEVSKSSKGGVVSEADASTIAASSGPPTHSTASAPAILSTSPIPPLPTAVVTSNSTSAKAETSPSENSQVLSVAKTPKLKSLANLPVLGPDDRIAEGDSLIIYDLIDPGFCHPSNPTQPLADTIFRQLNSEVRWQKMLHQQGEVPRLVCCQGEFGDDGSKPVYRHPADNMLPLLHFSPAVQWIRRAAEKQIGHPLNHVLIQLYRGGNDYISEHSDKTLDIAKGSSIVNVSFGAQRTMRLRTKKDSNPGPTGEETTPRETQRVAMPHNSMFVLGLKHNDKWLHGIMADKRLDTERSELETAYSGARISLTFRHIATFLDAKETVIWGQGASSKDQRGAADIVNNDEAEAERMIRAFSRENHSNDFSWDEWYGDGFDVLHIHEPPEQHPILFAGCNALETKQVRLALWESKIDHRLLEAPRLEKELGVGQKVLFRDNDTHFTEVEGVTSALHYLDRYYSFCADKPVTAAAYVLLDRLAQASSFVSCYTTSSSPSVLAMGVSTLTATLHMLSDHLADHGGPFIAGKRFSLADCVIWPVLDDCIASWTDWDETKWPGLMEYYKLAWKKKSCLKKLRGELPMAKQKI